MKLISQILAGLVALVLLFLGVRYMFTPDALSSFTSLTPDNEFGKSNIRAMGAPLLMLGILTGIGAIKAAHEFLRPVALYFLMLIIARIVTIVADGSDATVIRALVVAVVFFVVSEGAMQVMKRLEKQETSSA